MSDIVDVFEKYANSYGWRFSYGNKYNQNLLQSDLIDGQIYMLLDPVTRQRPSSEYGGRGEKTFNGSFLLVVKSTIDQVYHNQTNEDSFRNRITTSDGVLVDNECADPIVLGKYIENIKPLLDTEIVKLEDDIDCSNIERPTWSVNDVTNIFDANMDGIVVTYSLKTLQ